MNKTLQLKIVLPLIAILVIVSSVGSFFIGTIIEKKSQEDEIKQVKQDSENEKIDAAKKANESQTVGGAISYKDKKIFENASNASNLTTLITVLKATGLDTTLLTDGNYTIFAPDNTAFEKLTAGTVDDLLKPENKQTLTDILSYHIVYGRVKAEALSDGMVLKTITGKDLKVKISGEKVMINEGFITLTNAESSNGVLHIIDTVLLP